VQRPALRKRLYGRDPRYPAHGPGEQLGYPVGQIQSFFAGPHNCHRGLAGRAKIVGTQRPQENDVNLVSLRPIGDLPVNTARPADPPRHPSAARIQQRLGDPIDGQPLDENIENRSRCCWPQPFVDLGDCLGEQFSLEGRRASGRTDCHLGKQVGDSPVSG
jgi:hypothetical protein